MSSAAFDAKDQEGPDSEQNSLLNQPSFRKISANAGAKATPKEEVENSSSDADESTTKPMERNVSYKRAPKYMQYENVFTGYRVGGTYCECWLSLFEWHTETWNAWTVILNSVFAIISMVWALVTLKPGNLAFVFVCYACGALLHCPWSTSFHVAMPINRTTMNFWRRMDLCAIFYCSVLMTFSLAFFVLPWWGLMIDTLIAAFVATAGILTYARLPEDHELDKVKHSLFVGLVVWCYLFPMAYACFRDAGTGQVTVSVSCFIGAFICKVLGALVFANGWPECQWPGKFDVWGHSHQTMHWFVAGAYVFEFFFLVDNYLRFRTTGWYA